jgi:hypothetical protein
MNSGVKNIPHLESGNINWQEIRTPDLLCPPAALTTQFEEINAP